jgi:hypothetical protein
MAVANQSSIQTTAIEVTRVVALEVMVEVVVEVVVDSEVVVVEVVDSEVAEVVVVEVVVDSEVVEVVATSGVGNERLCDAICEMRISHAINANFVTGQHHHHSPWLVVLVNLYFTS